METLIENNGHIFSEEKDATNEKLIQILKVNEVFSEVLRQSAVKMAEFTRQVDENNKIPNFGIKSAELIKNALQNFDNQVEESKNWQTTIKKRQELEAILDTSLNSIFLKQLSILRELAISHFKSAASNDEIPADFAFFAADTFYLREAEESIRPGSYWNYSNERTNVHNTIREISNRRKQLISEKIQHADHQANAFQYLQMQQAQIQAMQQQQYGGSSGSWNIGLAYRPPDSNLNISMGYQQGRTNIQISMVPDEQASLLGPNGFTSGVGPANLGLSLNLNL
nr:GTP-binding protein isoform 1 [Cryptomonas curvata]